MTRPFRSIDLPFSIQTITYRRGDTLPSIFGEILDEDENPYDLTDRYVQMYVRRQSGVREITGDWAGPYDMQVLDAVNGVIYRDLDDTDTASNPGMFELSFRVYDLSDVLVLTVPTDRDLFIRLRDNPNGLELTQNFLTGDRNPLTGNDFLLYV